MDSYVVRIYRRDEKDPRNIAGQVEFVERQRTESFVGVHELMKILAPEPEETDKQKRTRKSN